MSTKKNITNEMRNRAIGCMLGQLAGDSLGGLVEFRSKEAIAQMYPNKVTTLEDGGTWGIMAGQPTDDSEMALALARSIIKEGTFKAPMARVAYKKWKASFPFDMGFTTSSALSGYPNMESQANGALMRISPLAIFCAMGINGSHGKDVYRFAREDADITHPNKVCMDINEIFVEMIARLICDEGEGGKDDVVKTIYDSIVASERFSTYEKSVQDTFIKARTQRPIYEVNRGWVLVAFQNAVYQLFNARSFDDGVVDTVMQGGDTDTNAAICGALLGAYYGADAVPQQWRDAIAECIPDKACKRTRHPRPKCYHPNDAETLAVELLEAGGKYFGATEDDSL